MLNKETKQGYEMKIICVEDLHFLNNGRPSIDPVVLFKMVVYQFAL